MQAEKCSVWLKKIGELDTFFYLRYKVRVMKRLHFYTIFLCHAVFMLMAGLPAGAQISHGGVPVGFSLKSKGVVPVAVMAKIDTVRLLAEDAFTDTMPDYPYRFSKNFSVHISPANAGLTEEIKGRGRLWRVGIRSPGAYSIHLIFDRFKIPPGATLFLYDPGHTHFLGSFTSENNKPWGSLAVAPLPGDEIIVEYFEPFDVPFRGELSIGTVGHAYRDIFGAQDDRYGLSQPCNKDINCPEGADWQVEKHAVCRIIFSKINGNSYLCTGSLINTTRKDQAPYFLTANHCLPTDYEASTAVYYFNYESPSCNGGDGSTSQTLSGSVIQATTTNLDFSLVKMSDTIPQAYKPYFAGWNASPDPPDRVVCIHHPKGDVKKIALYDQSPVTGDFIYLYDYDDSTHWYIENWTRGITEGGSSGSPLFDQDHLIVGDLTGGSTVANCTSADAFFEKFSHSFADYPRKREQLRYWLDPDTTGIISLEGYGPAVTGLQTTWRDDPHVRIIPNPSDGLFRVEWSDISALPVRISIYNLTGAKILERAVAADEQPLRLSLEDVAPGIYLITIRSSRFSVCKKIFVR